MPTIAEGQFPWPKNSISMPFDAGVRGGWRTYISYKFVIKCSNFRPVLPPATLLLLSLIRVLHKLDSGTEL